MTGREGRAPLAAGKEGKAQWMAGREDAALLTGGSEGDAQWVAGNDHEAHWIRTLESDRGAQLEVGSGREHIQVVRGSA